MTFRPDPKPEPSKKKKYRKIRPRSPKMIKEMAVYKINRKIFLEENPKCGVCKFAASNEVHHMKGRGVYLNIIQFWLAICRPCHRWVTENPYEALEKGYSLPRLS